MVKKDFEYHTKHQLVQTIQEEMWTDHAPYVLEQLKLSAARYIPADVLKLVTYTFYHDSDFKCWVAKWEYVPPTKG